MADFELTYSELSQSRPDEANNALTTRRLVRAEPARFSAGRSTRTRSGLTGDLLYLPERKLVTILSADVKGSMALSRSIELEEWWIVIADLFEVMCEGVSLFHGWVGCFTGDGVMAVFEGRGTPQEHAHQACDAALWLRDATRRRAEELRRQRGLDLSVRIGVNSGEVLTGTIGRRHGCCFTANGYAIALAKRIEALAIAGHVFISEHTAQFLGHENRLRDMGTFDVKGAASSVRVFELLGRR